MKARILLTTITSIEAAEKLADSLVEKRLAACVTTFPETRSTYRWNGKIERTSEIFLMIKTVEDHLQTIQALFAELHPYEVPEFIALEPTEVEAKYLAWLSDECLAVELSE